MCCRLGAAALLVGACTGSLPDGLDGADAAPPADDGASAEPPLGSQQRPATSCLHIRDEAATAASGTYWVDPDGLGVAIDVHCDMTTEGGGWTFWVADGLRAYWSFDGANPSRSTLGDIDGALEGTARAQATVLAPAFGSALQLGNEATDRLSLTTQLATPPRSTFAFWTRHTSCVNNKIPIYFSDTSYMGDLRFHSGQIHVFPGSSVIMGTTLPGNCSETINSWIHHVYVDDGSSLSYFRNGSIVVPDVYRYVTLAGLQLASLGSRPDFNTNGLAGQIDDVAVFDRALSDVEIQRLHAQGRRGRPFRWR